MAGRILNRRELRKQTDQAEQAEQTEATSADATSAAVPAKKKARAKAPAKPTVRKPRAKKAAPRQRVRWGIFDACVKQVAVFDYNQRGAADEKLAELLARGKGLYYMQIVKEPMPEPEPAVAAE